MGGPIVVHRVTTLTPYVMRYTGERMRTGQITPDTAHSYQNHLVRSSTSCSVTASSTSSDRG
jgi:hypothetical protein